MLLLGGGSHAGKSTLGQSLATALGGECLSTDALARHPGRLWVGPSGAPVPPGVLAHYQTYPPAALLTRVLTHDAQRVLPLVEARVQAHVAKPAAGWLVLAGSALWPSLVHHLLADPRVHGLWLLPTSEGVRARIRAESAWQEASPTARFVIRRFVNLTLRYTHQLRGAVTDLGLANLTVTAASTRAEVLQRAFHHLDLILPPALAQD